MHCKTCKRRQTFIIDAALAPSSCRKRANVETSTLLRQCGCNFRGGRGGEGIRTFATPPPRLGYVTGLMLAFKVGILWLVDG